MTSTLFILVAFTFLSWTTGQNPNLECFSCISTPADLTCLNNPEQVLGLRVVSCANGWCTIRRQEQLEIPGKILQFLRGCENKSEPIYTDDVVVDSHFVWYFRSCRTSRCNTGDGLKSLGSGGGGSGGGPIIVPEDRNSAPTILPNFLFILPIIFSIFNILGPIMPQI